MLAIPKDVSFEEAAMTEPLACVLRGLHETGVEIGETVTVIGAGTIGLMFMQVAKLIGCNVIAVVKRDEQVAAAKKAGAHEVVQITKVSDPVEAVRAVTPERRGSDVVIECRGPSGGMGVGHRHGSQGRHGEPVRRMRQRNQGRSSTPQRLHYSEITLKATFHHTPETVRRAFALITERKIKSADYITGEAPLSRLQQVLRQMLNRNGRDQDGNHSRALSGQIDPRMRSEARLRRARLAGSRRSELRDEWFGDVQRIAPNDRIRPTTLLAQGWARLPPAYAHSRRRPYTGRGARLLRAAGALDTTKIFGRNLVPAQASASALLQRLRLLPHLR